MGNDIASAKKGAKADALPRLGVEVLSPSQKLRAALSTPFSDRSTSPNADRDGMFVSPNRRTTTTPTPRETPTFVARQARRRLRVRAPALVFADGHTLGNTPDPI